MLDIQLARGVAWTINLDGGATQLGVVAPPGAPAEVKVVGGASQVNLDGIAHTGVAGGNVFADPDWDGVDNRYAVDLLAGVSQFEMSRSGPPLAPGIGT
jgi:hypothetical protein